MRKSTPSTFSAWQEACQTRREIVIDQYLSYLQSTRVKVRHVTDLADLVAKHISNVEGGPCNKSTLLRNIRYKSKLLTYQARAHNPRMRTLSSRTVADPAAKALITTAELESGNLKRELERLNIYTSSLEEQLDRVSSIGQRLSPTPGSEKVISDCEVRFVRTCQALRSLLSHLQMVIQVDSDNRRILDMSKRRNNVIVGEEVAGPFCDWLKSQGGALK